MKILIVTFLCGCMGTALFGQPTASTEAVKTGPAVGQRIPAFTAADQHGVQLTSESMLGPKGALLVFFRSADW